MLWSIIAIFNAVSMTWFFRNGGWSWHPNLVISLRLLVTSMWANDWWTIRDLHRLKVVAIQQVMTITRKRDGLHAPDLWVWKSWPSFLVHIVAPWLASHPPKWLVASDINDSTSTVMEIDRSRMVFKLSVSNVAHSIIHCNIC